MMEKEIKAYGDRKDTIIRFVKKDNVKLGKVYVLYPSEYDDMRAKITELELELAIQKSKNKNLREELSSKNTGSDLSAILDKLDDINDKIRSLESKISS